MEPSLLKSQHASLQSILFRFFLTLINSRYIIYYLMKQPWRPKFFVPKKKFCHYHCSQQTIANGALATIHSKLNNNWHIIYLHGGAFTLPMNNLQWNLVEDLLSALDITTSIIDYPLSPEHNYKIINEHVLQCYTQLLIDYPEDKFIILGDSAGGGLALSLAYQLLTKEQRSPRAYIMVSPWLNLTPSLATLEMRQYKDRLISPKIIDYCAALYAAESDRTSPLISPIYALPKLVNYWLQSKHPPQILVMGSNSELISSDVDELEQATTACADLFTFSRYANLEHDWLLFPVPERSKAIAEICEFVRQLRYG